MKSTRSVTIITIGRYCIGTCVAIAVFTTAAAGAQVTGGSVNGEASATAFAQYAHFTGSQQVGGAAVEDEDAREPQSENLQYFEDFLIVGQSAAAHAGNGSGSAIATTIVDWQPDGSGVAVGQYSSSGGGNSFETVIEIGDVPVDVYRVSRGQGTSFGFANIELAVDTSADLVVHYASSQRFSETLGGQESNPATALGDIRLNGNGLRVNAFPGWDGMTPPPGVHGTYTNNTTAIFNVDIGFSIGASGGFGSGTQIFSTSSSRQHFAEVVLIWGFGGVPGGTPLQPLGPTPVDPFDRIPVDEEEPAEPPTEIGTAFLVPVNPDYGQNGHVYLSAASSQEFTLFAEDNLFDSFVLPDGLLPPAESAFSIIVNDVAHPAQAGTPFDFTALNPEGVSKFSIAGLAVDPLLDPHTVLGVSFVNGGLTVVQQVVAVPEPASLALLIAAAVCFGFRNDRARVIRRP